MTVTNFDQERYERTLAYRSKRLGINYNNLDKNFYDVDDFVKKVIAFENGILSTGKNP